MLNRIFCGIDSRQPVAFTALASSIMARSSVPVSITPLLQFQLPVKRRGLTEFTFTRYLPPMLCDYDGWSLFLDGDMIVLGDVAELFALADDRYAVQVVDTPKRFERPSLMLFNNAKCKALTVDFIERGSPMLLEWGEVGFLPKEWNHCLGYEPPSKDAKVIHYTMGLPCFDEVKHLGEVETWFSEFRAATSSCSYEELMGGSIHRPDLVSQ